MQIIKPKALKPAWILIFSILVSRPALAADDPFLDQFTRQYDLSPLLKPKTTFLGFIDPNYRRLWIEFTSVAKSASDPAIYVVSGTTRVKTHSCLFAGKIRIDAVKAYDKFHYGVHEHLQDVNDGFKSEGEARGSYRFDESPPSAICGSLQGKMTLFWYVDKDDRVHYDDLELAESDGYRNNQYEGTWVAGVAGSGSKKPKRANWGEYRIPGSGDLDIGAGEFGANPKYRKQGW